MTQRQQKGRQLFLEGYTCSQAVLLSFSDVTGLDESVAGKLSSVFGGGMSGMRGVCGAVTGAFMAMGLIYGFERPVPLAQKTETYARARQIAEAFNQKHQSVLCKELLAALPQKLSENPSLRDDAYYKERPCVLFVEDAIAILEDYLNENPVR